MIFCDESSQAERFFVLGALYFAVKIGADHKAVIAELEQKVSDLKAKYGLFGRVKWEKVPSAKQKNKLEGYRKLIGAFAATRQMRFKCVVVDTSKYPLDNKKRWLGGALEGYLKFYCVFLCDGILARYPDHFYDITMDGYTFRKGNDSEDLRRTVEGRYVNKTQRGRLLYRHCDLNISNEQESNLLQLTDLLIGAVAFCWNGGKARTSARAASKKELVELLESAFEIELNKSTYSRARFGIWQFAAKA